MLTWSFVFLFAAVAYCRLDNRYCQCCLPIVDADPLGILLQLLFVDYLCFGQAVVIIKWSYLSFCVLLLLSGDIQPNPGPELSLELCSVCSRLF